MKPTTAQRNDVLRTTFLTGRVVITSGVDALEEADKQALLTLVREFKTFTEDNDPYGEHDFGKVELNGTDYFWKIDNYGPPEGRVLTIMRADEY